MKIRFDRRYYLLRSEYTGCWYFSVNGSGVQWERIPNLHTDPKVHHVMQWLKGVVYEDKV